ncbi:MAG: PmoA family protein [Kiritimatiellaeota bacterium]|nr:PmoA family protein [Kiritimatiellota bacterium]
MGAVLLFGLARAVVANEPQYRWRQTDSSLALADGERIVWQLNFKKEEGKPYFHPLTLNKDTTLTALRPQDHPWHRGLWWSWKFINGVNYWEENRKTGLCDGRTELVSVKAEPASDYAARVEMQLSYHVPGKAPLLTERRLLEMSAPDAQGDYAIDWTSVFTAGPEDLKLDRTPPKNMAGGYAGLSCRLSAACKGWTFTDSAGRHGATNIYGQTAQWVNVSRGGGLAIFDHPDNLRHPTPWYPNDSMPFFSPALLFREPYLLPAGKTITLRYRVWVHSSAPDSKGLEKAWQAFAGKQGPG